jgi:uncharacterized NAD(P)/FAD-binding protein YdhS
MRIDDKLEVIKGKLIDISEDDGSITVEYFNKTSNTQEKIQVGRVINCTGPQVNVQKSTNELLYTLVHKGLIQSDLYRLGIVTTSEYEIVNANEKVETNLYTLGGNLRGMLWETTAVPELKKQCHDLASILLSRIEWSSDVNVKDSRKEHSNA